MYEVRRITFVGRTKDCRAHHGRKCARLQWWCRQERTARCRHDHPQGGYVDYETGEFNEHPPWCRGGDGCRGKVKKGRSWRSLRTVWVGDRLTAELLVRRYASKHAAVKLTIGEHSHVRRAHYLLPTDGLPSAEAFLVAAPAGVVDKQRKSFETRWRDVTGRAGTVFRLVRELPKPAPKRKKGAPIPIRRAIDTTDVTLTA